MKTSKAKPAKSPKIVPAFVFESIDAYRAGFALGASGANGYTRETQAGMSAIQSHAFTRGFNAGRDTYGAAMAAELKRLLDSPTSYQVG